MSGPKLGKVVFLFCFSITNARILHLKTQISLPLPPNRDRVYFILFFHTTGFPGCQHQPVLGPGRIKKYPVRPTTPLKSKELGGSLIGLQGQKPWLTLSCPFTPAARLSPTPCLLQPSLPTSGLILLFQCPEQILLQNKPTLGIFY